MVETVRFVCSDPGCDRKIEAPAPEPSQIVKVNVAVATAGPDAVRVLPNLIFTSGPLKDWVSVAGIGAKCPEHSKSVRAAHDIA